MSISKYLRHVSERVARKVGNTPETTTNVVVGSSHRVGSTWLFAMLRDAGAFGVGRHELPDELFEWGTIRALSPTFYGHLQQLQGRHIFKTHALAPQHEAMPDHLHFVSVYRDPRDVLVSSCFYIASLSEEKGGWGESFRELTPPERIILLMSDSDLYDELASWYHTPLAYQVSYEELKRDALGTVGRILQHVGIDVDSAQLEEVIRKHSFQARTGRKIAEERKGDAARKGIVGDWRNYFDDACLRAFKEESGGRWNRLLVVMGYEGSLDWSPKQQGA